MSLTKPSKPGDRLAELQSAIPGGESQVETGSGVLSINGRPPPPLHLWHPEYCGNIDMRIGPDGTWYHEGRSILRKELWQLFASILRREEDGEYYLVTPVEKCRVDVALHPLMITDINQHAYNDQPLLVATLNSGGEVPISDRYPLRLEPRAAGAAYIELDHGLSALCSRAAWYRLADVMDETCTLVSAGCRFTLFSD